MKRHENDPAHFSLLVALDRVARERGLSILDPAAKQHLLEVLETSLNDHTSHKTRVSGLRDQNMFSYVVAALGKCRVISEEDSGLLFSGNAEVKRPDFRIQLQSGEELLVEVKSFYQKNSPFKHFTISGSYLASVKNYAAEAGCPLKFAVYWSSWNLWTLVDACRLDESQSNVKVRMEDAFLANEMYLLGDFTLGTIPPISVRAYVNQDQGEDGGSRISVSHARMCAGDVELLDRVDWQLAKFLMEYGNWAEQETYKKFDNDGTLLYIESQNWPGEDPDEQEPSIFGNMRWIGHQSSMLSRKYRHMTSENGKVRQLTPDIEPDKFAIPIGKIYPGRALRLWCFTLFPKHLDYQAYLSKIRGEETSRILRGGDGVET